MRWILSLLVLSACVRPDLLVASDTGMVAPDGWVCSCDTSSGPPWEDEICAEVPWQEMAEACSLENGVEWARDCFDCVCVPADTDCP